MKPPNSWNLGSPREFAQTDCGSRFAYRRFGQGPTKVILAHGFGMTGLSWWPFAVPHLRAYSFYALDFPGHGGSFEFPPPKDPSGFLSDYAACLQSLAEGFAGEPYILCGYSLGAYAGLFYLTDPASPKPSRYLHMDHPPFPQAEADWAGSMNGTLLNRFDQIHEIIQREQADVSVLDFKALPDAIRTEYGKILALMGRLSMTEAWARSLSDFTYRTPLFGKRARERVAWPWAYSIIEGYRTGRIDLRDACADVRVPTVLVAGARNRLFSPAGLEFMASRMPNAKLFRLERSGHDLHFREPFVFSRLFRSFLAGELA